MNTLGIMYLTGVVIMAGLLIRQVIPQWADRPLLAHVGFVQLWALLWPLVGCVWLMLWIEGDRDG